MAIIRIPLDVVNVDQKPPLTATDAFVTICGSNLGGEVRKKWQMSKD